jgi:hypothetical protein
VKINPRQSDREILLSKTTKKETKIIRQNILLVFKCQRFNLKGKDKNKNKRNESFWEY